MKLLFALGVVCWVLCNAASADISQYNVVWHTPSNDSRGSMPLGNGDIGLNLWVERGALYFYISKTDSWDENCRLVKVGKVGITIDPNPFESSNFTQVLQLTTGTVQITVERFVLIVWVDANNPAVYVDAFTIDNSAFNIEVELIVWRTVQRQLTGNEASGARGVCFTPVETPDTVLNNSPNTVTFFHRNTYTPNAWQESVNLQGLGEFAKSSSDPINNRTFGGILSGTNLKKTNATLFQGQGNSVYNVSVVVFTSIAGSVNEWVQSISNLYSSLNIGNAAVHEKYFYQHSMWWNDFWAQSFVQMTGTPTTTEIAQLFSLSRFMDASGGGRGTFPIKFNGLIFTTDYFENGVYTYNADYRAWGGGYWFQNTRFPYWTMLTNGDFEMMMPLFNMYKSMLPLAQARTQAYFGHQGAFFPETLFFWGTYLDIDYGCQPHNANWQISNTYMRYHVNGGLELLAMMLSYYQYTQDATFVANYLLPLAESEMNFFQQHYMQDITGKQCFTPSQSLETWQEAINPLPDIAGLTYLLPNLVNLPGVSGSQKNAWNYLLSILPALPQNTSTGSTFLMPAGVVLASDLANSENAELYAVFPFPLYGVNLPNLNVGVNTFNRRRFVCSVGWCQDLLDAALLGLTNDAVQSLQQRMSHPLTAGYRFPVFTGPFFDYVPEEDQNAVGQLGVQYMLMQTRGQSILLFPAWPAGWDVHFKFFAPSQTTVEVVCAGGKITQLTVTPSSRRSDVVIIGNTCTL